MLVAAVALTLALGSARAELASPPKTRSCPVTIPTRAARPVSGFTAAGFNYGNAYLRAHLYWPHGTIAAGIRRDGGAMAIVNRDGSISVKLGWWRVRSGQLTVTGRRLDRGGPPLKADLPHGYGSRGFQPSGLTFPTVGCWRVVGKVGQARLSFVVKVTKLNRR